MNIIKGLLIKDILQLKSYWKTTIIYIVVFTLIGITQGTSGGVEMVIILMLTLGFGMFTMASFNYDEQAKADSYILSFPLDIKQVLVSKYILVISATVIGAIVGIIFSIIIDINTKAFFPDIGVLLYVAIGSIFCISIIEAIQIPCIYKWGSEKGRIHTIIAIALIFLIIGGLAIISQNNSIIFSTNAVPNAVDSFLPIFLIILTALIYYTSYKFSYKIYESK